MAQSKTDFSQYPTWEKITRDNGAVYYKVPGTNYLYAPFESAQTGKNVLYQDASLEIQDKKAQEKAAKDAGSPLNQAIPIVGGVAGAILGNQAVKYGSSLFPTDAEKLAQVQAQQALAKIPVSQGGTLPDAAAPVAANNPILAANAAPVSSNAQAFNQGVNGAEQLSTPVPENFNYGQPNAPVNYGAYAQTGLGALQAIQGVNQFRSGNKVGGTINTAAGLGNAYQGGSALLAPASTEAAGSALGTYAIPGLNIAAGLYGGYQTADMIGNAASGGVRNRNAATGGALAGAATGAGIGTLLGGPLIGTALGAGAGALIGGIGSAFGSSKGKRQMTRDSEREFLKEQGILDQDYLGTLADGTRYDFGRDGGGMGKIDYNDKMHGEIIQLANTLAAGEGYTGGNNEAIAEMYARAALSNANGDYEKARQNIMHFAEQRGFTPEALRGQLQTLNEKGELKEGQFSAFNNYTNELFRPKQAEFGKVDPSTSAIINRPAGYVPPQKKKEEQFVKVSNPQDLGMQLAGRMNGK